MFVPMPWIIFYHIHKKTKDLSKKNCLVKHGSKNNFDSTDIVLIIYMWGCVWKATCCP